MVTIVAFGHEWVRQPLLPVVVSTGLAEGRFSRDIE